jgi:hypothetical protein
MTSEASQAVFLRCATEYDRLADQLERLIVGKLPAESVSA